MTLDQAHVDYLVSHHRGRLATIAPNGAPQNKPVGYHYDASGGFIDISGLDMERSAKYRNIASNPEVAFVVDDSVGDGASGMRFLEIRGRAEQVQGEAVDGLSPHRIRIWPRRVVSWNVGSGTRPLQSFDLDGDRPDRPAVALGSAREAARKAVDRLVDELQQGLDTRDADVYNRHFADDVIWGSPYGATVAGYDTLHAIHDRLTSAGVAGPSRYEVMQTLAPAPGVALAHVRRNALDDNADVRFSEMALYVLVRRDGQWWLAAGQNTPIRPQANPDPPVVDGAAAAVSEKSGGDGT